MLDIVFYSKRCHITEDIVVLPRTLFPKSAVGKARIDGVQPSPYGTSTNATAQGASYNTQQKTSARCVSVAILQGFQLVLIQSTKCF